MTDADKDRIEGKMDQAKGFAKEGLGKVRDDEDQEAEGKMDQGKGELKEKMGNAKEKASDAIDSFKKNR